MHYPLCHVCQYYRSVHVTNWVQFIPKNLYKSIRLFFTDNTDKRFVNTMSVTPIRAYITMHYYLCLGDVRVIELFVMEGLTEYDTAPI